MLLPLIWLGSFCFSLLFACIVRFYYKKQNRPFTLAHLVAFLGLFVTIIFGFLLTPLFSAQLTTALKKTEWPSVDGEIIASSVVGERAFRPDIRYEYYVKNKKYSGSSSLNVPGFGGRMNRLDAAEKLTKSHPVESFIAVYYNPDNPLESTLVPQPGYSHFIKLGTSTILFNAGLIIIFLWITQGKRKSQPHERI
ncbi:DUF3592 domain-containing protein [candidate division KSB1 bacterium]|nr:DUF3592 domain-containing protein [candidate division KSB1 bacterium]RQW00700.1 MAG: DUF3592 domain-containing protein [candidate division KSB1 bacterium]